MDVSIYVLPTEEDRPPRAVLHTGPVDDEAEGVVTRVVVTWSRDMGTWLSPDGLPVPSELAEAITTHAKNLGVEW